MTDLSRIKWGGAKFVSMLYDLGYDTVEKVTQANPEVLHEQVNRLAHEKNIYKGHIGLNDINIFIEASREVPLEIEY